MTSPSDWRHRHEVPAEPPGDPLEVAEEREDEAAGEVEGDLAQLAGEAEQYREHLQRLQAEFDNYRKRVTKEQAHAVQMAAEPLARRVLEVLDDFELALMHAGEPDENFVRGVELVYAKLLDALKAEGIEPIDAEGAPFDPEQHEALMQEGDGNGEEPVVADVLRRGYTMKGRVIRPAGVKVKH